jgi:hypothetical protein
LRASSVNYFVRQANPGVWPVVDSTGSTGGRLGRKPQVVHFVFVNLQTGCRHIFFEVCNL